MVFSDPFLLARLTSHEYGTPPLRRVKVVAPHTLLSPAHLSFGVIVDSYACPSAVGSGERFQFRSRNFRIGRVRSWGYKGEGQTVSTISLKELPSLLTNKGTALSYCAKGGCYGSTEEGLAQGIERWLLFKGDKEEPGPGAEVEGLGEWQEREGSA